MVDGRPPPLKNPPIHSKSQMGGIQDPKKAMGIKKPLGSGRELDANGNPIRKPRAKKQPKPAEEVQIFFRVRSKAESLENEIDPGFAPSPVPSY